MFLLWHDPPIWDPVFTTCVEWFWFTWDLSVLLLFSSYFVTHFSIKKGKKKKSTITFKEPKIYFHRGFTLKNPDQVNLLCTSTKDGKINSFVTKVVLVKYFSSTSGPIIDTWQTCSHACLHSPTYTVHTLPDSSTLTENHWLFRRLLVLRHR